MSIVSDSSSPDASPLSSPENDLSPDDSIGAPDRPALDPLLPDVYEDLRRIARIQRRRHAGDATLNTTAVVHEAYLKLRAGRPDWTDTGHFLALAARAMRQLLVDDARRRRAGKRGGGVLHVTLTEALAVGAEPALDLLALDAALQDLARLDPVLEQVVECRFFAGLSVQDTAQALGRSTRSVERDWARARAYLFDALGPR